jgi:hypothetical protein
MKMAIIDKEVIDIIGHRQAFLDVLEPLDREAREIVSLIQSGLPDGWSGLYDRALACEKANNDHPVDRLIEYRLLAGKLAYDLQRMENMVSSIKRRAVDLSARARELMIKELWKSHILDAEDKNGGGK